MEKHEALLSFQTATERTKFANDKVAYHQRELEAAPFQTAPFDTEYHKGRIAVWREARAKATDAAIDALKVLLGGEVNSATAGNREPT